MNFRSLSHAVANCAFAIGCAASIAVAPAATAATTGAPSDPVAGSVDDSRLPVPGHGGCADNIVIYVPGGANTATFMPRNLPHGAYTEDVGVSVRAAAHSRVADRFVPYMAAPGASVNYEQARNTGLNRARSVLAQEASACPQASFSIFGYSMGADIASRLAGEIGNGHGPIDEKRLNSAVLLANPNRGVHGVDQAGGAPRESHGAFGPLSGGYDKVTDRVLDICQQGDYVCDSPDGSDILAQAFAKTAVLSGGLPLSQIASEVNALPPAKQAQFYAGLPKLIPGQMKHVSYYGVNAVGVSSDYLVSHLS